MTWTEAIKFSVLALGFASGSLGIAPPSFASSNTQQWKVTCEKDICAVSFFFSAGNKSPNLDGGVIFTQSHDNSSLTLRVISPLGSNLQRGISIDLGPRLLANLPFKQCSKVGCVADTELRPGDVVDIMLASQLGITVWDESDRGFRSILPGDGLRSALTEILKVGDQQGELVASLGGNFFPSYLTGHAVVSFAGSGLSGCPAQADQSFAFKVNDRNLLNKYYKSIERQVNRYAELTDGKSNISDGEKLAVEKEVTNLLASDLTSMANEKETAGINVSTGNDDVLGNVAKCGRLVLYLDGSTKSNETQEDGVVKATIRSVSVTMYDENGRALNNFPIESDIHGDNKMATGAIPTNSNSYERWLPFSSVVLAHEIQGSVGTNVEIKY